MILLKLEPDYLTQLIKHYGKSNFTYTKKPKSYNGSWSLLFGPHYFSDLSFATLVLSHSASVILAILFFRSIVGTSVIEDFVLAVSCPRMFFTFGKNSLFQIFAQISLWYFEFLATILYFQVVNIFPYSCHGLMVVGLCFLSLNLQLGHFICFG